MSKEVANKKFWSTFQEESGFVLLLGNGETMSTHRKIRELLIKLITEGEAVLNTKWQPGGNWVSGPPTYVELAAFKTWRARCKLLASLLGKVGKSWENELISDWDNRIEYAITTQST